MWWQYSWEEWSKMCKKNLFFNVHKKNKIKKYSPLVCLDLVTLIQSCPGQSARKAFSSRSSNENIRNTTRSPPALVTFWAQLRLPGALVSSLKRRSYSSPADYSSQKHQMTAGSEIVEYTECTCLHLHLWPASTSVTSVRSLRHSMHVVTFTYLI